MFQSLTLDQSNGYYKFNTLISDEATVNDTIAKANLRLEQERERSKLRKQKEAELEEERKKLRNDRCIKPGM